MAGSGADSAPGSGTHHGPVAREFEADASDLNLMHSYPSPFLPSHPILTHRIR